MARSGVGDEAARRQNYASRSLIPGISLSGLTTSSGSLSLVAEENDVRFDESCPPFR